MVLDDQDLEDVQILRDIEEEEEEEEEERRHVHRTQTEAQKRRKTNGESRESKSIHWNDYIKVWVEVGDLPVKRMKGKCKRCGTLIAADLRGCGTNGLKNHTASCLKRIANSQAGKSQTILNYSVDQAGGNASLTSWKFDKKAIRLGLCKMIILDELPFTFVEREGFRSFVQLICPQFQISSIQTIRTDCVRLFLEHKEGLNKFFKK